MVENMFYARIDNLGEFKKLLEVIKDIVPNVNLEITSQGISFSSNEFFHVIQVNLAIPVTYFSEYKCSGNFSIGLSLKDLHTLLKLGHPEDSLVMQTLESVSLLKISLEASNIPKICEFSLNLIILNNEECNYFNSQNYGRFEMSSKMFYHICNDLCQVSEFLKISINKIRVKFSINSDDAGGSISLKHFRSDGGITIQTPRTINTEVNLIYAKRIAKAHVLADRVEVRAFPDEPVVFTYKFNGAELLFYLAPSLSD